MNRSQKRYAARQRRAADRYLSDNLITPWFVRQLIPAPGEGRSAFKLGSGGESGTSMGSISPLIGVAARQYCATRGALAGAPEELIRSTTSPDDVVPWIAHLLTSLEPADRRSVVARALSRSSGPRRPHVPFFACIPPDATPEQSSALIDGLGTLILALGSSGATDSVSTVTARAASIASRQPFAADPQAVAGPNDVSLAKMLLDAYMADGSLRDEIFASAPFKEALARVVAESAGETVASVTAESAVDASTLSDSELELQRAIYDCVKHEFPLGGEPAKGDRLALWLKNAAGKVDKWISAANNSSADDYEQERIAYWRSQLMKDNPKLSAAEVEAQAKQKAAYDRAVKYGGGGGNMTSSGGATDTGEANSDANPQEALDSAVTNTKQLIDDAIERIASTRGTLADQQEKMHQDALEFAKLMWASEILSASDDVAEILAGVRLNASDPSAFITSAMSVLPAAKASGSLTTIKALANALRSAASRSGVDEGSVLAMLTGDPEGDEDVLADGDATPTAVAGAISARIISSWGGLQGLSEGDRDESSDYSEPVVSDESAPLDLTEDAMDLRRELPAHMGAAGPEPLQVSVEGLAELTDDSPDDLALLQEGGE